ncbi:GDSL esterase/lipase 1-like [Rosa rugosa]|uniref:GDSL esterase/lipase 1-like n=1 Tax=Rosa rugosa TaxID=74645 RepID=UPI002B41729C|nr:GDSL esterase/lipase 1-like [Rosa rugosa]
MASLAYCVLLLVTVLSFSPDSCFCAAHQSKPEHKAALFVFGDSLFDPGNNKYLNNSSPAANAPANRPPYGETYFNHATGRYSDGRIVPDFIAKFAKLPFPPPYLQPGAHHFTDGVSFASGGAGVFPGNFGAIDFPTQLSYFKAVEKSLGQRLGDKETKKLLGRAVYLFSIGGNDYFSYASNNPNATQIYKEQYVAMVIGNLTSVLKEIYNLGGRKIAFQNVGALGCTPGSRARNPELGKCYEESLTLARLHNRALFIAFKKLEKSLPGFKFSIFDYYNAIGDRIFNPSKYGFKVGKAACCGSGPYRGSNCGGGSNGTPYELCSNPSEYVWFDGAHTTESANQQLAELIWNGPQNFTGPYTVKKLFDLA